MNLDREFLSKLIGEIIGTFTIIFVGCGTVMMASLFPASYNLGIVAITFGLVVAAMIYTLGHVSGAHFNPAVTAAFCSIKRFPLNRMLFYWAAQIIGAVLAIALLSFLVPETQTFGETVPSVAPFQALVWEIIITFFLMFVVMGVATDSRAVGAMAGATIGATIMFTVIVSAPLTGASMNPARSFAPALFKGDLSHMGIYFFGPLIGAIAAAKIYNFIRHET